VTVSAVVLYSRLAAKARLRHLQLLATIGELGNLQKAAAAIGMSQPAATHALAELEALVGAPLFERHAKGMRPTALGAAILPMLRKAMRSLQECAEVIAAMGSGTTSSLRVGAIGAAVSGLLTVALPSFSTAHPEVVVDVTQLTPDELMVAAAQRSLDIAVCREPRLLPDGFEFIPILSDRYAVVCSPRHPLARRSAVEIDELAEHTWLMPPPSGLAGHDFERLWASVDREPKICWVTSRSPLIMWAMLEQRQLVALVPSRIVIQFVQAGVLVEVNGPWNMPLPPIGAIVRSTERHKPGPLKSFVDALVALSDL
jgi:DNA-binding transcriptional LysR family regulator